jgi:4-hydroxy-4-methyl-2-oxoglutarate aldolase
MISNHLDSGILQGLRELDSSAVANAIETFGVRVRNTGFTDASVRCFFPEFPPTVGYAATVRIRTSDPPMEGESYFYRLDWLDHVLSIPEPRIVVIEDMDLHPGLGAFIGDVHTRILSAAKCAGIVTNGAVRNIEVARDLKFQLFAKNLSVSHAYAHVFDFGSPIQVGHMAVHPGDLIHGDRNGVQTVPLGIADRIPEVAKNMKDDEKRILDSCRPDGFNVDRLRAEVAAVAAKRKKTYV